MKRKGASSVRGINAIMSRREFAVGNLKMRT